MSKEKRCTFYLDPENKWFQELANKSILLNKLIRDSFGDDFSQDEEEQINISARKCGEAQKVILLEKRDIKKKHDESDTNRASPTEKKGLDPG